MMEKTTIGNTIHSMMIRSYDFSVRLSADRHFSSLAVSINHGRKRKIDAMTPPPNARKTGIPFLRACQAVIAPAAGAHRRPTADSKSIGDTINPRTANCHVRLLIGYPHSGIRNYIMRASSGPMPGGGLSSCGRRSGRTRSQRGTGARVGRSSVGASTTFFSGLWRGAG